MHTQKQYVHIYMHIRTYIHQKQTYIKHTPTCIHSTTQTHPRKCTCSPVYYMVAKIHRCTYVCRKYTYTTYNTPRAPGRAASGGHLTQKSSRSIGSFLKRDLLLGARQAEGL